MERSMYEWCRRKFIKAALRREHQRRMEFDCNLRMQQQVRCGKYHAIRWPDDFTWSIWHEGHRGYLMLTTIIKFVNLSAAIEFIKEKSPVVVIQAGKTLTAGEDIEPGQIVHIKADGKAYNTASTEQKQ